MKLATHNSLSSYEPKRWWMRILNPFAKCQSLSIEEQFNNGVRMFDIRVRPHTEEAAHGLVTYDVDVDKILIWLDVMAKSEHTEIYIRLCCENNLGNSSEESDELWFWRYWQIRKEKYSHLVFCGGYMKKGWHKVINCKDPEYLELYRTFNVYKAKNGWKAKFKSILGYICHPTPKYWAKKDNANYIEEYENYNGYLMLDFIEYATENK